MHNQVRRLAVGIVCLYCVQAFGLTTTDTTSGLPIKRTVAVNQPGLNTPEALSGLIRPSISHDGSVAFQGLSTAYGTSIWLDAPGQNLTRVAGNGDLAPGLTGQFFQGPNTPNVKGNATVLFDSNTAPNGPYGFWQSDGTTLSKVVSQGEPSPIGSSYIRFQTFRLNHNSQIAFRASLSTNTSDNEAIFSNYSGTLSRVGLQAPGPQGNVISFQNIGAPMLNDLGVVTYYGSTASGNGAWIESSAGTSLIAFEGQAPPGIPTAQYGNGFSQVAINNNNQFAFQNSVTGPGINYTNNGGIWTDRGPGLELLVRLGEPTPNGPGKVFAELYPPMIGGDGSVVFGGQYTDGSGSYTRGIWVSRPDGSIHDVAAIGEAVPGIPGATFLSFEGSLESISVPVLFINANGTIVFRAGVSATPTNPDPHNALWAFTEENQLIKILESGDTIDVDDDPLTQDLRRLTGIEKLGFESSGGQDGRISPLNDSNDLVLSLSYETDGPNGHTSGIFVLNVPTPGSLGLLAAPMVAMSLRRRQARA